MAGDLIGLTQLTGLSITSTPGSAQTTLVGPALVVASGATFFQQSTAWSVRTLAGDSSLASIAPTNADCAVLGFVLRASGLSLILRSGNSIYHFNSAASGAAV